ncbi:MAG: outer membrane beta-barrel protein [Bacteroidia bacterium]|nr:PorT family protein [Bacteroidia bacterium]MDW8157771.1 outer membrane beta-barrel protein [Bacteroidia bacterium]
MPKILSHILLIAIIVITFYYSAYCQKRWQGGFMAYPQACWALNSTDRKVSNDSLKYEPTYGVAFALKGGYSFNSFIGLGANIIYSSQGQDNAYFYRLSGSKDSTVRVLNQLRLRYLKIPILFKVNTNANQKLSIGAQIGPQLDILTSIDESNNDTRYFYPSPPRIIYTNFPERIHTFHRINLSLATSLDLDIKIHFNLKMNIQIRTDYGFLDIENKDASFYVTENGVTRQVKYYHYTPPITPNYTHQRAYVEGRSSTHILTLGLGIGFTYYLMPDFDYIKKRKN